MLLNLIVFKFVPGILKFLDAWWMAFFVFFIFNCNFIFIKKKKKKKKKKKTGYLWRTLMRVLWNWEYLKLVVLLRSWSAIVWELFLKKSKNQAKLDKTRKLQCLFSYFLSASAKNSLLKGRLCFHAILGFSIIS